MEFNCSVCNNGVASDGNACVICGGVGTIELTESNFANFKNKWQLHGLVWNMIFTYLSDLTDKINDIKEKVDEL